MADTTEFFLDAGQTAVKIRGVSGDRQTTLSLSRIDTSRAIAPQIVFAASQFAEQTGMRPWRITVSSTALSQPEHTAWEILAGVAELGTTTIVIAHDSIGGYLSAVGSAYGAVAAVGTGVVTLGVGPKGFARVDGWGNIIGDAGSGYWIGRLALESAMRAFDGRGPRTALVDVMAAHFTRIEDAYLDLQSDPDRIFRVASFAKLTIDLASSDQVASDIVARACDELVISIGAALTRSGFTPDQNPVVSWTGSVATNPLVSDTLHDKVLGHWPHANYQVALGEPLDGVEKMVGIAPDHPLGPHILTVSHH